MNFISQFVDAALWASFRSLPPNEAMVAVVSTDMIVWWQQKIGKEWEKEIS